MKNTGNTEVTTPSDREIAMTRTFNAPRNMVFEAWTKPELVKRWLGVRGGWSMPVCEIDLKVGGKYRYVWRKDADGTEMGMGGVFREVVKPERLVATEVFDEAWYPGEALDTTVFVEKAGKTTVATSVLYGSKEIRDGVLESGMAGGVSESYDKLDEMLASTQTRGSR